MYSELVNRKRTKAEKKAIFRQDFKEPILSRRNVVRTILGDPRLSDSERQEKLREFNIQTFNEDIKNANIYGTVAEMLKAIPEKTKHIGQKCAGWYLEDFNQWLIDSGKDKDEESKLNITATNQIMALEYCPTTHKELLCKIFEIGEQTMSKNVKEMVKTMIAKRDFLDATRMVKQYNLFDENTYDELVLPLFLMGYLDPTFDLLAGRPEELKKLIRFLDSLVSVSEPQIEAILQKYKDQGIQNISTERFFGKKVEALIRTAVGKSDLDEDLLRPLVPNFIEAVSLRGLKHQIEKREANGWEGDIVYFHHMQQLKDCVDHVQEHILHHLWNFKTEEKQIDAISLALYLGKDNAAAPYLPGLMRDFFRAPDERLQKARDLLNSRQDHFRETTEPMVLEHKDKQIPIHIVKTEEALAQLCSELKALDESPEEVYVGLDTESTNEATAVCPASMAMAQIFFHDKIYLVDFVLLNRLAKRVSETTWKEFGERLFKTKKVKLIGFDLRNDIDTFLKIPAMKQTITPEEVTNAFCLKKLAETVCDINMDILKLEKKTFKLVELAEKILNLQITKIYQQSPWGSRPLCQQELQYAAMDAVIVIQLYKDVLESARKFSNAIDMKKLVADSNVSMIPKAEKSKNDKRKFKVLPWAEIYSALKDHRNLGEPVTEPHEMKFIADVMLNGFGCNLRRLGFDVFVTQDLSAFREQLQLIERANSKKHRILTIKGKSYDAMKSKYGSMLTGYVNDFQAKPALEQLGRFLDDYNVELREDVHFDRCIECNSRLLVKFPKPVIHFLHQYNIVHLQNVTRADTTPFPLEAWWNRMHEIRPADYDDIEVKMSRPSPDSSWIVATVPTGCLHITRNTVIHNNNPDGAEVAIHKIPDDEFKRRNLCFFICGDCGAVHFDPREEFASHGALNR